MKYKDTRISKAWNAMFSASCFQTVSNPDKPGSGWSFCVGKGLSSLSVPIGVPCWSSQVTSSVDKNKQNKTKQVIRTCKNTEHNKNLKYCRNWDYFNEKNLPEFSKILNYTFCKLFNLFSIKWVDSKYEENNGWGWKCLVERMLPLLCWQ